jgi:hypothetical protein
MRETFCQCAQIAGQFLTNDKLRSKDRIKKLLPDDKILNSALAEWFGILTKLQRTGFW